MVVSRIEGRAFKERRMLYVTNESAEIKMFKRGSRNGKLSCWVIGEEQ